jgi:hypothetical protein
MTSSHDCVKSKSRLPWPEPTDTRPLSLCISTRYFPQALSPEVSEKRVVVRGTSWYESSSPLIEQHSPAWGGRAAVSTCFIARTCGLNASHCRGRYIASDGVDEAKCLSLLQGDVGAEGESSGMPQPSFLRTEFRQRCSPKSTDLA